MLVYLFILYFYIITSKTENEIDIKDAGVGFIAPDDIGMIFYVTLFNNCERDYEISVSLGQCCENTKPNENFCGYMYLIGGYMGVLSSNSCKNVTLIYPNLYLFNRQGVCTVTIRYTNQNAPQHITTEIEFKTTNCEEQPQCPSLDLDPMDNCNPVECVAKYSGGKNYFNPKCKECECNPICVSGSDTNNPQLAYNIASNQCESIKGSVNMTDLELIESNQVDTTECEQTLTTNIICHHGYTDTIGKCICHNNWITTDDNEIYDPSLLLYHMCNIETGAWNCINSGRIKTTALLIAIFAITIASKILIIMCILNWFYRRYRAKGKSCSHKLDPEDEGIILCEDISSTLRCLCEEHPKSKEKNLRTETVNVTFYPCAPSTYSSVRASTISERNRYVVRSDQSILLSNTTSTSVPESYQSETDVTTEDSEYVDDEDNYEIEFSVEEEIAVSTPEDECCEGSKVDNGCIEYAEEQTDCSESGRDESRKLTEDSSKSKKGTSSSKSRSGSSKSKTSIQIEK